MNRKECIDDLNYIKKALTEGTLTRYDAIVFLIDTLTEYLKGDKPLEQWQKEFHEVVESLDVEKFKTFYRMYQDNVYGGRPMPKSDKVIMASMCKVALEITTISEATKKKADEWLEANNFTKGIWR
nr:MAG TPA: hypothetical protein [Caudoviricetes sp.]